MAELIRFDDCPEGLFWFDGTLCFMSEYVTSSADGFGQRDAYVVESGEYFWGGVSDPKVRAELIVHPITDVFQAPPRYPIKLLEWIEFYREGNLDELEAETPFRTFYNIKFSGLGWHVQYEYETSLGVHSSVEEAISAVQRDYENRIESVFRDE